VPHRFPALMADPPKDAGQLWLTGARVFDGCGGRVREDAAVLVDDGVIARIGDAAEPCPQGARPLDVHGRTVMPGLIEAHAHLAGRVPRIQPGAEPELPGTAAHFVQAELRGYLRRGVTTIRFTGSSQSLAPQEARQAMRYGAFRGPRLLTCGKIISATAPGGRFYGQMYREADGADDVRRAVREQIRAGADFIKLMTTGARSNELEDPEPVQLTEEELAAAADETHRLGYRLCAHAEGLAGCEAAIKHGVDTIEHGMYLHQRPDMLTAMAAAGTVLVPTLSGYYEMAGLGDVIDPSNARPQPAMPPMLASLALHNLDQGATTLRAASRAGVAIAAGGDVVHGTGLEICRMIHHGLTAAEALIAATGTGARALGLDEQVGTVEPGKLADLLITDGDPLREPELLTNPARIWLVVQLGIPVAGQALEAALGALAGRPSA